MISAALFAGQVSERVGMGSGLAARSAAARALMERVSRTLGWNLGTLLFEGPEEELAKPVNTQLAVLTVDLMAWEVLRVSGRKVDLLAGFSLGALAALVAGEGISLEGATAIVVRTAEIYDEMLGGLDAGMAAVVGVSLPRIEEACRHASRGDEIATVASRSHPAAVVLTGVRAAIRRALDELGDQALRVRWLPVSWPMHSPLLEPVTRRLDCELDRIAPSRDLACPVVSPLDGAVLRRQSEVRRLAGRVVVEPVRWDLTLERCLSLGVEKYYECGEGEQIGRMLRWWRRDVTIEAVGEEPGEVAEAI